MAGKHKWDEFLDYDDWKKEEEPDETEAELADRIVEATQPKEIQGIGIAEQDEVDLAGMIAGLNAANKTYEESFRKEESQALKEKKEEEAAREAAKKAEEARQIYEKEQAEKEARQFEEAKEEAARIAAELEKKQNSLFGKIKGIQGGKKSRDKKEKDTETAPVTQGSVPESEEEDAMTMAQALIPDEKEKGTVILPDIPASLKDGASSAIGSGKVQEVKRGKHAGKKEPHFPFTKEEKERSEKVPEENSFQDISAEEQMPDLPEQDHAFVPDTDTEPEKDGKGDIKIAEDKVSSVFVTEAPGKKENGQDTVLAEQPAQEGSSADIISAVPGADKGPEKETKGPLFGLFGKKKGKENIQGGATVPAETQDKKQKSRDKKEKAPDWEFLATHDEMTGLFNQRAYLAAKEKKREEPFAVIYIDVNNLKYTNDNIGHEAGNELITKTAQILDEMLPEEGFRTGGDEFIAIMEDISVKKADKILSSMHDDFHKQMEDLTKKEKGKLVYAASFGYAWSDGSAGFEETAKKAEEAMYAEKAAYKKAHPEYDMRRGAEKGSAGVKGKETLPPKPTDPEKYDELLSEEQRALKQTVREGHVQVSEKSTMEIVREIQNRATDLVAILIASPAFDHLFIIQDADTFINILSESDSLIDYSYLYIMYSDGPVYKGSDEYLEEVTDLFNTIGRAFVTGQIREEKDILKIKGINIFKNIYVD